MITQQIPRLMIAGTNSGCGKTTIACGILAALKNRKVKVCSCKCGPDYIDPMFHKEVLGIPSKNLDLFFTEKEMLKYLLLKDARQTDIAVMEGVMGFYDGMQMDSPKASSYELAKITNTPVILVVKAKGMALSVLSIIKGFLELYPDNTIKGVILNGVSKATGEQLKKLIERELKIKVYGCVPLWEDITLHSRHLGLVTPYELEHIQEDMQLLGKRMEECVLLDELMELAQAAPELTSTVEEKKLPQFQNSPGKDLKIGIGMDKAFCFYYRDNLAVLEEAGCKLIPFSPLADEKLPEELDGLILGGGYPELYGKQLSENSSMRESIRQRITQGIPCMAECGGFMYLHKELQDQQGTPYPMVGIIDGQVTYQGKLVRFGYSSVECKRKSPYMSVGDEVKAHEFHYWDSTNNGTDFLAKKPSGKRSYECIHGTGNLLAGFPHFYFYSNLELPMNFLKLCREYHHHRKELGEKNTTGSKEKSVSNVLYDKRRQR